MRTWATIAVLLVTACSGPHGDSGGTQKSPDLENAAIARGIIRDPAASDITGLYTQDRDRICIVPDGNRYEIGALADYGNAVDCSATGTLDRAGDRLAISFGEGCRFDARYDGRRVIFPARLPGACARFCHGRASFAALDVATSSQSAAEAHALADPQGRPLCP